MLLTVLSLIHNALTLLFGVYVSAAFLGVKMNRKNVFVLLLFSVVIGGVYLGSYLSGSALPVPRKSIPL